MDNVCGRTGHGEGSVSFFGRVWYADGTGGNTKGETDMRYGKLKVMMAAVLACSMLVSCSYAEAYFRRYQEANQYIQNHILGGLGKKGKAKQAVSDTLYALSGRTSSGEQEADVKEGQELPGVSMLAEDQETIMTIQNTGIAEQLAGEMEFEILSLSVEGEEGEAELKLTVPDASQLFQDVIGQMDVSDVEAENTEVLLKGVMEAIEDKEYDTMTCTVTVELRMLQDQWYLVNNQEFSNAISGGLLQAYAKNRQEMIDNMGGGEE